MKKKVGKIRRYSDLRTLLQKAAGTGKPLYVVVPPLDAEVVNRSLSRAINPYNSSDIESSDNQIEEANKVVILSPYKEAAPQQQGVVLGRNDSEEHAVVYHKWLREAK